MIESGVFEELDRISKKKNFKSMRKLFLLDFDGTLVDFSSEIVGIPPPKELVDLLKRMSEMPDCSLVIITGRSKKDIEDHIGSLKIDIVAEHGAIIRESGIWNTLFYDNVGWKKKIFPVIKKYGRNHPDSIVEDKYFSLAWHYRNLDEHAGNIYAEELIRELNKVTHGLNVNIMHGKKVIEIISKNINKGLATKYLTGKEDFDFILSIGDDKTDEDMFRSLEENPNALTIKIGEENTCARYTLKNVQEVKTLLDRLLTGME